MGVHRKGQSNRVEYCPVCDQRLTNRAAATAHYRAHARRNEITERTSGGWYFGDTPGVWFQRGYTNYGSVPTADELAATKRKYLWEITYGRCGQGGRDKV